ncbi:2,5-dichloro-2,5-cyclohexadiene-1,4-diol dehydrogenase [Acaryochloris thomasi RCC1774]|uniref:2,5-dichloro-2,5-cyclohexadiene-1,4-diol dehydrogenase n=1 Tax=Acaryochloris thomasi RCC1774 TaxID=1764569 RepID=A0A2W1JRE3_9CYAN|nr:SDR family oxidoreductase [Acaryochloris thomasi]PZD73875.1 2,5-dichloro-2,5-cyclohexadiene-1,4-diol dehydrogenase [Acaryochloris thomasi RCC1774]
MFLLTDKIAVVTGGASGIGEAVVQRFLAAGATVYSIDRVDAAVDGAKALVGDVSQEADIVRLLETVAAASGRIDILINNAGVQPLGIPFSELTEQTLRLTFEVNVNGVAFGVKHAPNFMPETGGRIINTSSFVGLIGIPLGSAYAVSKAAVVQITKCAAIELAVKGITVNAIAPGTVLTPAVTNIPDNPEIPFVSRRTPLGRLAKSEEIAAAFHFLASDEAAYITGAILPVDGGITAGWESYDLPPPDPRFTT